MLYSFGRAAPLIHDSAFISESASIIGDVAIGADCSVWFGAVIRGDYNSIKIGKRTNIQDLCILHTDDKHDLVVGDDVTIGHRAIIHGCKIGNLVLVGMGAIIMNDVEIGDESLIAAGALVTEGIKIPPRSLMMGTPAKIRRQLTDEEAKIIKLSADVYVENARRFKGSLKIINK